MLAISSKIKIVKKPVFDMMIFEQLRIKYLAHFQSRNLKTANSPKSGMGCLT
jgi:hypothetical protein